ncbi:MAG TPA: hypothetical protein VGO34_14635 [Alphaproteobacteria bacterium]|jgi:hypothetical protein
MGSVNDAIGRVLGGDLHGAERDAFLFSAEADLKTFELNGADMVAGPGKKVHVQLTGAESFRASVQVLAKGRDKGLREQPDANRIYMVLKGRVKFYGAGDVELGDFGPHEGILLPEKSRYRFDSVGDEEAWLLHVAGDPGIARH